MIRWTLELPDRLRSQNAFKDWRTRHRDRQHWQYAVLVNLLAQGHRSVVPLQVKQRITITRHLGPRERLYDDGGGIGGSMKQIVDAVKRLGWMHDDSPRWCEQVFAQDDTRRDRPGVTITLEEIQDVLYG